MVGEFSAPRQSDVLMGVACLWKEILRYTKNILDIGKILMLERTPKEEELMCKARIMFDDLWKCSSSGTGRNCQRICTSMTPDLLRGRRQTSRWDLIIRFKDYNCGWWSKYVIVYVAIVILCLNMIVGSQDWFEYSGSTNQGNGGRMEWVAVCSESLWFGEQCCLG